MRTIVLGTMRRGDAARRPPCRRGTERGATQDRERTPSQGSCNEGAARAQEMADDHEHRLAVAREGDQISIIDPRSYDDTPRDRHPPHPMPCTFHMPVVCALLEGRHIIASHRSNAPPIATTGSATQTSPAGVLHRRSGPDATRPDPLSDWPCVDQHTCLALDRLRLRHHESAQKEHLRKLPQSGFTLCDRKWLLGSEDMCLPSLSSFQFDMVLAVHLHQRRPGVTTRTTQHRSVRHHARTRFCCASPINVCIMLGHVSSQSHDGRPDLSCRGGRLRQSWGKHLRRWLLCCMLHRRRPTDEKCPSRSRKSSPSVAR